MSDNLNITAQRTETAARALPAEPPKKQRKQRSIYGDQLICLAALAVLSIWQSGHRALVICICSMAVCVLSDMLFCKMTKKTYNPKDLSTVAAGLCIALMMPASVNYAIVAGGAFLAISVKHIFGGKDNYIFNPTCVAIAFLIICYPTDMLMYPAVGSKPELWGDIGVTLVSGTESYLMKLGTAPSISVQNILLGNFAGPMGTTQLLVMAVCAVCLLCRRSMSVLVTVFGLGSYIALTMLFPAVTGIGDLLMLELSGGYLVFGFIFLASDPQTMPRTAAGKIAYGIVIGILGCLFRHFGKVEGSFIFVLLIANALSVSIDEACAFVGKQIKKAAAYLRNNMGMFEKLRRDAEKGEGKKLTDTMEIIVPPTNYYMPPIDNKVTKIKRRKTNIITRYTEKLRLKRRKDEIIRRKQLKDAQSNYMSVMRGMQKKSSERAAKTEEQKENIPHIIKQPKKRSMQKNNKQGNSQQ